MPNTDNYGFEYESPGTQPGVSITGGPLGNTPIFAEQADTVIAGIDTRVDTLETTGYRYSATQYFTSSGTFSKGLFPGARAVRVRLAGGGGSGGGCAAGNGDDAVQSGGGGGGGYAEAFVDASILSGSESVTVGSGGTGAAAGDNDGSPGGTSSFGGHVSATGGQGGSGGSPATLTTAGGGNGGTGSGGDLNIDGSDGGNGRVVAGTSGGNGRPVMADFGGGSVFGGMAVSVGTSSSGRPGRQYGGGSSGASVPSSGSATGSTDGSDGVVIVDVFV